MGRSETHCGRWQTMQQKAGVPDIGPRPGRRFLLRLQGIEGVHLLLNALVFCYGLGPRSFEQRYSGLAVDIKALKLFYGLVEELFGQAIAIGFPHQLDQPAVCLAYLAAELVLDGSQVGTRAVGGTTYPTKLNLVHLVHFSSFPPSPRLLITHCSRSSMRTRILLGESLKLRISPDCTVAAQSLSDYLRPSPLLCFFPSKQQLS